METFEPLIQVLTLLTVLSVLAERLTNILKLRNADLSVRKGDKVKERERELGITWRSAVIGIFVALLLKANFFEIVASVDNPWKTLGWIQSHGARWTQAPILASPGGVLYAFLGCALTGLALGFGSKFWHDIAGAVYEMRDSVRRRKERDSGAREEIEATSPATSGVGTKEVG